MSTFVEAENYIGSIPKFAPKTGLDNTRTILSELGNPEKDYKSVHIAGTNGKGSIAKMMSLMLQEQGYKVGLFISPHLVKINERMSINGVDISDADFVDIYDKVTNATNELINRSRDEASENDFEFQHPAYFEFLFVMAACYFSQQGCDYVVFETGLGGRLDATNVIIPEVSIIASIGLDHMQYLGNTITDIAGEKAGIIKSGVPVVFNTGEAEADAVIIRTAEEKGSKWINVGEASSSDYKSSTQYFDYEELLADFDYGAALYQLDNAKTAITAFREIMAGQDDLAKVPDTHEYIQIIKSALGKFYWSGRMEYVATNILMDGAHNEDAAKRFVESIRHIQENDGWQKLRLLFAVSSDKDYDSIVNIVMSELELESVYIGELNSDRRLAADRAADIFREINSSEPVYTYDSIDGAWDAARETLGCDTLLIIMGSLYMVGEIKRLLNKDENK